METLFTAMTVCRFICVFLSYISVPDSVYLLPLYTDSLLDILSWCSPVCFPTFIKCVYSVYLSSHALCQCHHVTPPATIIWKHSVLHYTPQSIIHADLISSVNKLNSNGRITLVCLEPRLVPEWTGLPRGRSRKRLSGPMGWILSYIKTYLLNYTFLFLSLLTFYFLRP